MAKTLIVSRPDNLGDTILTLPMAGFLRKVLPGVRIVWLGQKAVAPVVACSAHVDTFLDVESVVANPDLLAATKADAILHVFPHRGVAAAAKKAGIAQRIGTSHRWYHWHTCNHRVDFSRRKSDLHEAQLNFHLLQPLGLPGVDSLLHQPADNLAALYGFTNVPIASEKVDRLITSGKFHLVLHPKSRGSAREWPLSFYRALAQSLDPTQVQIYVTGTGEEGKRIRDEDPDFLRLPIVEDLTGKLSLSGLIAFLHQVDGLVACSTGPLHIAAALGKRVLGIYPNIRPMHPGRWRPLGPHAEVLVFPKPACEDCRNQDRCGCIERIGPQQVYERIMHWRGLRNRVAS